MHLIPFWKCNKLQSYASLTILEKDQSRLDYDTKKLQSYVNEKKLLFTYLKKGNARMVNSCSRASASVFQIQKMNKRKMRET